MGRLNIESDNDPQNASPRGCAIRFDLAEHSHTDIVAHSVNAFPVRTAADFLEDGDIVDDATVRWPEDRRPVAFGEISLTALAVNNASEQQQIIFDPIPRADGMEASNDPLFDARATVYLMSGRRRRSAVKAASTT